jgi:hypothetical protein
LFEGTAVLVLLCPVLWELKNLILAVREYAGSGSKKKNDNERGE